MRCYYTNKECTCSHKDTLGEICPYDYDELDTFDEEPFEVKNDPPSDN